MASGKKFGDEFEPEIPWQRGLEGALLLCVARWSSGQCLSLCNNLFNLKLEKMMSMEPIPQSDNEIDAGFAAPALHAARPVIEEGQNTVRGRLSPVFLP